MSNVSKRKTHDDLSASTSAPADVDVAIIGLGSAGEALARTLAKAGCRVVGFEDGLVGGECPFKACMPSKSMLHDAKQPEELRRNWSEAVERRQEIVSHLDDSSHAEGLRDVGVTIVRERAALAGDRRVEAGGQTWRARHVVLATGSSPTIPPIDGIDDVEYWTAFDALTSEERPERLVILGAGAIGSELATVYAAYGSSVAIVERGDRQFEGADPQVSERFTELLRDRGIDVHLGCEAERIEATDDGGVVVVTDDGSRLEADRLLVAVGQTPRTDGLGLESVDLDGDALGDVDDMGRVGSRDWLWAIGDLNGESPWTHGANREARAVGAAILDRAHQPGRRMSMAMPRCVFTDPPLAHVGTAAHAHDGPTVTGTARHSDIARGATDELVDGVCAVAVDADSGALIGFSVVGPLADEIVASAAALIHMGAGIEDARDLVFAFPTINQLLEAAIENAHDQLTT